MTCAPREDAKMLPGQEPYTSAEQEKLSALLSAACKAEEQFSDDELERFAENMKRKRKNASG